MDLVRAVPTYDNGKGPLATTFSRHLLHRNPLIALSSIVFAPFEVTITQIVKCPNLVLHDYY